MSRLIKAALLLLVIFSIAFGIILFRPSLVLSTLVRSNAAELGFEISSMLANRLGPNSTELAELVLLSDEQEIRMQGIRAEYSLSQLLAGRMQTIHIEHIELRWTTASEAITEEESTTLASLLEAFDAVPVETLILPELRLLASNEDYEIALGLQSPPLHIEGRAKLRAVPDTVIEFDIRRSSPTDLEVVSNVLLAGELAADANIALKARDTDTRVAFTSTLPVQSFRDQLAQYLPADTVILNGRLSLQGNFEVRQIFEDPSFANISIRLDSPNSQLLVNQESQLGSADMQLQLPLDIMGSIADLSGEFQFELSPLVGIGNWSLEDAHINAQTKFDNTALQCTSPSSCNMQSDWQSDLLSWRYDAYSGEELSLSAALRFNYSNEEMRVAADLVQIAIPAINSSTDSTGLSISSNLQLNEVELRVGDFISGGFNFSSSELKLGNSYADVISPAYAGKVQLEQDILTGILELDVNQSLRLGVGLQHFFLRDTGDAMLQIAAHDFSDAAPLSSLFSLQDFDADIVAGAVEGLANISWSKQVDESWRFGGPIALKLDGLSGYYQDYFFVDLSTDLFAEATTPLGMKITNPARASLKRLDVGLPLEDISWQYRFDSLTGELQIDDFTTAVLGGSLSIAAMQYDPNETRQQVDIVLADLNVESIVGLADYPGVYADGLVSGYLPFIVAGDHITIEKGLVGALNPGGNIRYTPTSSQPSSNQSLQLVNQALSNYQYQTMNTEVFYGDDGELLLALQLRGYNPDMNNGQAINLNVNITDNIPSLLKSLQASRVITDELERFMQRP